MNVFSDKYNIQARAVPQLFLGLPLLLLFAFYFGFNFIAAISVPLLLVVLVSWDFASPCGRKFEAKCKRNGDVEFLGNYISRIHKQEESLMSDDERYHLQAFEEARKKSGISDPFAAHDLNEHILRLSKIENWLREKTRDREKFPVVFDKNCKYGFQRNTRALRKCAAILNAISLCILLSLLLVDLFFSFNIFVFIESEINYILIALLTVAHPGWAIIWYFAFSLDAMREASSGYINAILRSVDNIEEK